VVGLGFHVARLPMAGGTVGEVGGSGGGSYAGGGGEVAWEGRRPTGAGTLVGSGLRGKEKAGVES